MKKYSVILLALLSSLILAACNGSPGSVSVPALSSSSSTAPANAAPTDGDLTQTNEEASVTVQVTPLNLDDKSAAALDFKIALNTHSVDLSYDLTSLATLSSDAGEKVQPTKWDAPPGGGHHKEGTLSFPQLKNRGQSLTLTLRGIADVPERKFVWKVK